MHLGCLTLHMVTTFGSGAAGGSVCILNLHEPLDILQTPTRLSSRISQIKSFNRTIWTADCNPHGTHAVIGTNRGAALLNLETKAVSGFYHIRSDVLSEQFIHSGNVVLCGLRNGAVVSIDTRQKQSRLPEHSARPPSRPNTLRVINGRPAQHEESSTIQKKLNSCNSVVMSSAVCSLVAFQSDERYFLASSMDGSIKLFDHRLLQRGAVQFYAGQVNSHTRLQLGVDPSETFVMSGGEDCFLRIWSIKNGELIFGERISDSILATICWPRNRNNLYDEQKPLAQAVDSYLTSHSWEAWLGSPDGLFYMHGT
ncbi:hypothetical protein Cni_G08451 [Canna indica]|uniref:Uncharacterized protein n=1 Tax=Canna indica TaxID=4628 RepID=A0AAQ3K0E4_9LILI|nr:hypothetical protein Cni_G08451 [Canna indica]